MRVIVPYPRTSLGGVETLTCALIRELTHLVEAVIWVLPDDLRYLARSIPQSERLHVEALQWPRKSWQPYGPKQESELGDRLRRLGMQLRLQYLIKKHNITHCLFPWTLHVPVPRLPIPITAVVYDRNWRKFPENFPYTTPATLDRITRDWVAGAKTIVTLSNSVQREVTDLCPQFAPKVRVVPAASTPVSSGSLLCEEDYSQADAVPIFYYPSTVGAHKGHFTLFQATLRLASKRYRFKVVLTGDRTGFLTGNEPMPLPIIPYVEQCREFYNENKAVLQMHIENLDLCDWQRVEQLYRCSRRVVLPSKYEGFGLPLMEALTRGCRVICSDIEPYRDQIKFFDCADFVQVFRADDFQALASHMEGALLASDSQRLSPIEATAIASRWTWYDTTLAIVSIMQEAPASRA